MLSHQKDEETASQTRTLNAEVTRAVNDLTGTTYPEAETNVIKIMAEKATGLSKQKLEFNKTKFPWLKGSKKQRFMATQPTYGREYGPELRGKHRHLSMEHVLAQNGIDTSQRKLQKTRYAAGARKFVQSTFYKGTVNSKIISQQEASIAKYALGGFYEIRDIMLKLVELEIASFETFDIKDPKLKEFLKKIALKTNKIIAL